MSDRRRFVANAYRVRTRRFGSAWTVYLRVRRWFLEVNFGVDR